VIASRGQGSCPGRRPAQAYIVAAFAERKLEVQLREVPLAEVATGWAHPLASDERIVFVP
jgi:hypothetical protein